jgi:hypothetical protein
VLACLDADALVLFASNGARFHLNILMQPRCVQIKYGVSDPVSLDGGLTSMPQPSAICVSVGQSRHVQWRLPKKKKPKEYPQFWRLLYKHVVTCMTMPMESSCSALCSNVPQIVGEQIPCPLSSLAS